MRQPLLVGAVAEPRVVRGVLPRRRGCGPASEGPGRMNTPAWFAPYEPRPGDATIAAAFRDVDDTTQSAARLRAENRRLQAENLRLSSELATAKAAQTASRMSP